MTDTHPDITPPRRPTAAERMYDIALAALQKQPSPPEHSLNLTRNAKQHVQIDLTVRGTDLAALVAETTEQFDALCAKYPTASGDPS